MTDEPDDPIRRKALLAHERLCAEYGCPIAYFHDLDPLSELVSSLLSHRTRNADSGRAFKELCRRFADWAAVRDAPTHEVREAVAACTWPELKAPRLQQILRLIGERRGGKLSLDFLADLSVPDARAWLEELPGVGPKTSAAVLSFSTLRRPALPVDSHHHRVAQRLGLIGPKVGVGPAHAILAGQLPPDWNAQQVYDNHEALMLHGQKCCFHASPACGRCVVLGMCPFGQAKLKDSPGGEVGEAGEATDVPGPAAAGSREFPAPTPRTALRKARKVSSAPPGSESLLWDDLPEAPGATNAEAPAEEKGARRPGSGSGARV